MSAPAEIIPTPHDPAARYRRFAIEAGERGDHAMNAEWLAVAESVHSLENAAAGAERRMGVAERRKDYSSATFEVGIAGGT